MSRGLLIVNADDYGFGRTVTDPVIAAYDEGLISSATAMVWMRDSERAGVLARERGMPVGLHLNFTAPFQDDAVPELAREIQAELASVFDASSWNEKDVTSRSPDPRIRQAVEHQLDAFRRQFGEPTHIDGHHHIHVHPVVLASLPKDLPIRPVLHPPNRLRARPERRDRLIREQFRTADGCVGLPQIHPRLGGAGLESLSFARKQRLEVVVHAQLEAERQAIHGAEWKAALSSLTLGSYRDL